MSKHNVSYQAKCPFYRSEDSHRVFCEGTESMSGLILTFSEPKQRLEYESKYCRTLEYDKCLVAQIHERRWEEIENEVRTGLSGLRH